MFIFYEIYSIQTMNKILMILFFFEYFLLLNMVELSNILEQKSHYINNILSGRNHCVIYFNNFTNYFYDLAILL